MDNNPLSNIASASTISQTISHGYGEIVLVGETLCTQFKTCHAYCTFVQPFFLHCTRRFHRAWKIRFCCHSAHQRITLGSNFNISFFFKNSKPKFYNNCFIAGYKFNLLCVCLTEHSEDIISSCGYSTFLYKSCVVSVFNSQSFDVSFLV